jgi:hypothetical protein
MRLIFVAPSTRHPSGGVAIIHEVVRRWRPVATMSTRTT